MECGNGGGVEGVKWKMVMEGVERRTWNRRHRVKGVKLTSNGRRRIECVGLILVIESEEW